MSSSAIGRRDHRAKPHFLVVTPSLNQGQYLEETIISVIQQGCNAKTYVVADGGSDDESPQIIDRYADRIDQIKRGPDRGQSDAIATAVDDFIRTTSLNLSSVWFNWINSDDRLAPQTLERLATAIVASQRSSERIDAVAFNVRAFGAEDYVMPNRSLSSLAMIRDDHYRFAQPGLWMRLDQYRQCGGIDRQFQYGFDWDLWVRYLSQFPNVRYIDAIGADFRLHATSKTSVESCGAIEDNRFETEHDVIRNKLSSILPRYLARRSIRGGRRRRWHQQLATWMDDGSQTPIRISGRILQRMLQQPTVCFNTRSVLAIARLCSRYIRPTLRRRIEANR